MQFYFGVAIIYRLMFSSDLCISAEGIIFNSRSFMENKV